MGGCGGAIDRLRTATTSVITRYERIIFHHCRSRSLIIVVVAAGFAGGNMPNNLKGLDARRDTAPLAFWLVTGAYLFGAFLLIVVAIRSWGN